MRLVAQVLSLAVVSKAWLRSLHRSLSQSRMGVDSPNYNILPRLYLDKPISTQQPVLEFDDKQRHYLFTVMRCKSGDEFRVFNGIDGEYLCQIEHLDSGKRKNAKKSSQAECRVIKQLRLMDCSEEKFPCILYFSPLKKRERMRMLIEKATEMGIQTLVPVIFDNTQHIHSKIEFMDLWKDVVVESCEQSERLSIPVLAPPITFKDLVASGHNPSRARVVLVCRERSTNTSPSLLQYLEHLISSKKLSLDKIGCNFPNGAVEKLVQATESLGVVIGPEGGFSNQEMSLLDHIETTEDNEIHSVSLGLNVLRAETAAIYALSVVSAKLQSICT